MHKASLQWSVPSHDKRNGKKNGHTKYNSESTKLRENPFKFFFQLKWTQNVYTRRDRESEISRSLCTNEKRFPYITWTQPMRLVRNGSGFGHLISGILNIFICAHVWKMRATKTFFRSMYSCENWSALYRGYVCVYAWRWSQVTASIRKNGIFPPADTHPHAQSREKAMYSIFQHFS